MITALIIMHFFGGGNLEIFSSSDFRTVRRTIEEPQRVEVVTQTMERMNEHLESLAQRRQQVFEQLADINTKIDSPEDAYDKVLDELWQARREMHPKYVEDVFILRENITRDEWQAAFGGSEK